MDKGEYIMLLKDIQKFICSEVNLYATSSSLSKKRLYEGFCDDVPEKFLNQKIISIEAEAECMSIFIDMDCEKLSGMSRLVTSPKIRHHDENFDSSLLKKRIETQPLEFPSAGSVFRNPDGMYAGELIEKCGLKGLNINGAEVSMKHANFIVNKGNATGKDVIKLINIIKEKVKEKFNVGLHLEQIIVD